MADDDKKSILSLGSSDQRIAQEQHQNQLLAAEALSFLDFMIGKWSGQGQHQNEAITGKLTVRRRLQGTFLEAHEILRNALNEVDYEDITIYRYSPTDQHLRVMQLVAPAWTSERFAFPLPDGPGVRWFGGPSVPTVIIRPDGDKILSVVHHPTTHSVESWMRYQRAD